MKRNEDNENEMKVENEANQSEIYRKYCFK